MICVGERPPYGTAMLYRRCTGALLTVISLLCMSCVDRHSAKHPNEGELRSFVETTIKKLGSNYTIQLITEICEAVGAVDGFDGRNSYLGVFFDVAEVGAVEKMRIGLRSQLLNDGWISPPKDPISELIWPSQDSSSPSLYVKIGTTDDRLDPIVFFASGWGCDNSVAP
jgi:hypothetical protein